MPTMKSAYTPTTAHAIAPNLPVFLKLATETASVRCMGATSPPAMTSVYCSGVLPGLRPAAAPQRGLSPGAISPYSHHAYVFTARSIHPFSPNPPMSRMCWCPLGRNAAPMVVVFSGRLGSLLHVPEARNLGSSEASEACTPESSSATPSLRGIFVSTS